MRNRALLTADVNVLEVDAGTRFDRGVSVEMFGRMRNYEELMRRVAAWMTPRATLFVHIFTHGRFAYPFDTGSSPASGAGDWVTHNFFSGGMMPSDGLLLHFQDAVRLVEHWRLGGWDCQQTSEAWLRNVDAHRAKVMPELARTY